MKTDSEVVLQNAYTPGPFPVLVIIFQLSIGVTLRQAHRNFLLKTKDDEYLFFLSFWNAHFFVLALEVGIFWENLDLGGLSRSWSHGLWFLFA